MLRVAIVGTRGIPNNYGGFETLAEYLAEYLAWEVELLVYCSSTDMPDTRRSCNGASLDYVPVSSHGFRGIIYDSICLVQAIRENDVVLVLGFGAGFVMPFIGKAAKKVVVNIGGLDWKRDKWSFLAKKMIRLSESLLLRYAGKIVADNVAIQEYIAQTYGRNSYLIAYGGDQSKHIPADTAAFAKYPFLKNKYCFSVARIQPDNNIDLMLRSFQQVHSLPLVLVGNWHNSAYGRKLKQQYSGISNLILLEAIYNRHELDTLRSNCTVYIHGHSAGGTNPSLVEAMYLGLPVFAFASVYNKHTTEQKAFYFENEKQLADLVNRYAALDIEKVGAALQQIAMKKYTWKLIAGQYEQVFRETV
jgi:glycosyltransferase involved in cell wall biosynthesis